MKLTVVIRSCFLKLWNHTYCKKILFPQIEVKVTTKITVENVEIGVADKDQSTAAKTTKYDTIYAYNIQGWETSCVGRISGQIVTPENHSGQKKCHVRCPQEKKKEKVNFALAKMQKWESLGPFCLIKCRTMLKKHALFTMWTNANKDKKRPIFVIFRRE